MVCIFEKYRFDLLVSLDTTDNTKRPFEITGNEMSLTSNISSERNKCSNKNLYLIV